MSFILMISGMAIVVAALVLFAGVPQRMIFVLAGVGVELLGLALLAHEYKSLQARRPGTHP